MANFDTIKTAIDANIKTNGIQDITGGKLNSILKQMVDATGEQLTELESETDALSTIIGINKIIAEPNLEFKTDVAVKWGDGSEWSYPGYNRMGSVTLQRGQAIMIRANVANQMAALYKTSHQLGWGNITNLVQGKGNGVQTYVYRATEDNTYVGATYKASDNIEVYVLSFDVIDDISDELNAILNTINQSKEDITLKEPMFLSSFPLRDGQLSSNGGSSANEDRKNTGVFAKVCDLHISVNAPFSVNYRYGDDATEMADGGYLISGGGEADVVTDAKYVGFTIVKPSSESFDNLKFFVYPKDSNDEKTLQIIEENKIESKRELNKVLYESNAIVEKKLATIAGEDYRNNIDISLKKGETILVKVDAPSGEFKTRGVAIVASYQSEAIGYANAIWTEITLTEDVEYIGIYRYRDLVTISEDVTFSIKKKNVALLQQKMEQIYNTTTLSNSKHTLAICDGYDINDNGELCAGMWAADNSVEEHDPPTWRGYLLRANLADLVGTREDIMAFDTWNEMIDNWTINYVQNSFACWLSDGNIALVSAVGLQLGSDMKTGYYCKVYDVESKTFGEPQLLTIKVGNKTYDMLYGYGTTSESDITEIWQNTNLEHFVRYETEIYNYNIGLGAIRYNGAYYAVMQLGSQSGALCKSSDMIHWEFLCDMKMGQITLGEVAITIKDGILYTIGRGEYQLDKHYGVVKKCTLASAETGNPDWSDSVYLPNTTNERPTITELNGKLYLMHGFGTAPTTDGRTIARGNKALVVMDLDLNVLQFDKLAFTYPLLHPIFKTYGGNIFNISSTDKRLFAWTKSGDTRSEIGFGHVNEKILEL